MKNMSIKRRAVKLSPKSTTQTKFSKVLQKKAAQLGESLFLLSMEQHKNNKKNLQKIKRKISRYPSA